MGKVYIFVGNVESSGHGNITVYNAYFAVVAVIQEQIDRRSDTVEGYDLYTVAPQLLHKAAVLSCYRSEVVKYDPDLDPGSRFFL